MSQVNVSCCGDESKLPDELRVVAYQDQEAPS